MRKIIFLMSVFFLFSSCSFFTKSLQEEKITISLPQWPPEDNCKILYPQLSRWKITIHSADYSKTFFQLPGRPISIKVYKNKPLSITAQPITLSTQNKETIFFAPAGYIYPYKKEHKLTWNEGFTASIMSTIFQADARGCSERNNFIMSFNWNKFSEILNEKINNISEPYNPWLLNRENIIKKITEKKFSSVYLNQSSVYLVEKSSLKNQHHNQNDCFLSSFIPVNKNIDYILLKKAQPQQFYLSSNKGVTITYISSKNISLDYCFLPILIEGL